HMAFDGQFLYAGHAHDAAGRAGDGDGHLPGADLAARRGDADDLVAVPEETRHFAILDDVDSAPGSAARIAPGDRVVPGGAAARLDQRAMDRKTRIVRYVDGGH